MVNHTTIYNKHNNIVFSFKGGASENDKSVNIIYFITNENCQHVLQNETKCFESNTHTKFKLKMFKRKMILQDGSDKIFTFFRCQDSIPKHLALKNISQKLRNYYIPFIFLFILFC